MNSRSMKIVALTSIGVDVFQLVDFDPDRELVLRKKIKWEQSD